MAKQLDNTEERIHKVEEALSRSEQFIERNQMLIGIVIGVIVVVVLGFFGFKRFFIQPREKEAQTQMWKAERYFEQDSIDKALKGDGSYPGFLAIMEDYSMTKSANLSRYYAGICYLKKGDFQNAITYLDKYKPADVMVAAMAKGGIGDAYMELGDTKKALDNYQDAADNYENEFTTPVFLMKIAWTYEAGKEYQKAIDTYDKIKKTYPKSAEARGIEKYIVRAKALMTP